MSTTVTKMEVNLIIPASAEVSGDMGQKWSNGLVANAGIINDRRKAKIADDGSYISKVATPSNQGFTPMIDAAFVSRKGRSATEIGGAHAKNGAESFNKWNDNLDLAFATVDGVVAKRFVDNVANKSTNWERAAGSKTLRLTGDKIRGRGASAIIAELLCGYQLAQTWLRPGDQWLGGTPYKIVAAGQEGALKAGLVQLITRAGLTIIQNNFDSTIMTAQNTHIKNFLDAMKDITLADAFAAVPAPGSSSCVFALSGGIFSLNTLVTLTA